MNDGRDPLFPTFDAIEAILWPAAALVVFIITAVAVDLMILLAARWRLVDLPNRRSAHSLPTARGGGLAVVIAFCLGAIGVAVRWPGQAIGLLLGSLLPCVVLAGVGFVDDIRPLRASWRLLIQIAIAVAITAALGPIDAIAIPGSHPLALGPIAWPLTVLWIVGLTNAFNFMDGSDGMAGLGAVVVGACIAGVSFRVGAMPPMVLAAFLAAAAGGFLVFNWPPARIFMGDVGSAFLGCFLASLPLLFPAETRPTVVVPIVLCLWPYIYDPFLSVLRRIWNRKNPLEPHREFLFHRLVRSGATHGQAALLYGLFAVAGGCVGLASLDGRWPAAMRSWLPGAAVLLAAALTAGIEVRCARADLVPAERGGPAPKPR